MFDISKYLSVKEAATAMGYTRANITRLIREGKLPAVKRGRKYFILAADLDGLVGSSEMFK